MKIKEKDIPRKLEGYDTFVKKMKDMMLEGTEKYTGGAVDVKETIDIMPDAFGEENYRCYILQDLLKRILRLKNCNRETDVIKVALWCFLYWKRFCPQPNRTVDEIIAANEQLIMNFGDK